MKKKYPKVAQIVVGLPVEGPFDYFIAKGLQNKISIGQRVRISFNRRIKVGFVIGLKDKSEFSKLNPILSILEERPSLDSNALKLTKMISEHYGCSWGEAIETYLPSYLRTVKPIESRFLKAYKQIKKSKSKNIKPILIHDINKNKFWPFIIEKINNSLKSKGSIIFLIPENELIESIKIRIKESINCKIYTQDKKLTPKNEFEQWQSIRSEDSCVVIGTRSSVFSPVKNLDLIIIIDEENYAYKQEQVPHYHIFEVAQIRFKLDKCSTIFVSSAPSAELWNKAVKSRWEKIFFEADYLGKVQIVDMTNYNPRKTSILSFPLQNFIQKALQNKEKIMLFMNRKGFSTLTRCNECGFTIKCKRCDVNLTYMYSKKLMVCRHCNFEMELPKYCPNCKGSYLRSTGTGLEKLASEVARYYPEAEILCYDKESGNRKFSITPKNNKFKDFDIIICTQAVLKHKESIKFDLVALLNFDAELNRFDFRSAHKAFLLLIQLRQLAKDKLLVQTGIRDNYSLKAAQKLDFKYFYKKELNLRKEFGLPPYKRMVALGIRGKNENAVFNVSKDLYDYIEENKPKDVEVSDPNPDFVPKIRDKYRYTIILKGSSLESILPFIKKSLKKVKRKGGTTIIINVDV